MENTERNTRDLNLENLLSSEEFRTITSEIASKFGVEYKSPIYQDVKQVCAIAVFESLERYDVEKCSGIKDGTNNYRFWHYAYGRMWAYTRREVIEQKNLVHIPENRLDTRPGYEKVEHSYEKLNYEDGNDKPFESYGGDIHLAIDIDNALGMLDAETRYIVEVHAEITEGKSGKSDFASIAKDLNMSLATVKNLYNNAKEQLTAYLR